MKPIGTKVYYTGDMANQDGNFEVFAHRISEWGNSYDLREVDGDREFLGVRHIADAYSGTCSDRFVTEEAHKDYRNARIEESKRAMLRAQYLAHERAMASGE